MSLWATISALIYGKLLAEVRIRQMKMPRSLYLVSRRGARLSHAAAGLMLLLNA